MLSLDSIVCCSKLLAPPSSPSLLCGPLRRTYYFSKVLGPCLQCCPAHWDNVLWRCLQNMLSLDICTLPSAETRFACASQLTETVLWPFVKISLSLDSPLTETVLWPFVKISLSLDSPLTETAVAFCKDLTFPEQPTHWDCAVAFCKDLTFPGQPCFARVLGLGQLVVSHSLRLFSVPLCRSFFSLSTHTLPRSWDQVCLSTHQDDAECYCVQVAVCLCCFV